MRLFLSGGGNRKQTAELDKLFSKEIDKNKPLLYIPIAINTEKHPYPECLKWLKSIFDRLGINNYTMWDEKKIYYHKKERIGNFAGIYIGGGNTPYLSKMLKDSGLWDFIKGAVLHDIPVYGGSAGAIIFGKTIISSLNDDENFVGLKDFSGMDLARGYEVWCHYDSSKDVVIKQFMKDHKIEKLIALPEETGLEITNKDIKVIGAKSAFLFKAGQKNELEVSSVIF